MMLNLLCDFPAVNVLHISPFSLFLVTRSPFFLCVYFSAVCHCPLWCRCGAGCDPYLFQLR